MASFLDNGLIEGVCFIKKSGVVLVEGIRRYRFHFFKGVQMEKFS